MKKKRKKNRVMFYIQILNRISSQFFDLPFIQLLEPIGSKLVGRHLTSDHDCKLLRICIVKGAINHKFRHINQTPPKKKSRY